MDLFLPEPSTSLSPSESGGGGNGGVIVATADGSSAASSSLSRRPRAPNLLLLFFLQLPVLAFTLVLVTVIGAIAAANYPTRLPECLGGKGDDGHDSGWVDWQPDQPTLNLVTEK